MNNNVRDKMGDEVAILLADCYREFVVVNQMEFEKLIEISQNPRSTAVKIGSIVAAAMLVSQDANAVRFAGGDIFVYKTAFDTIKLNSVSKLPSVPLPQVDIDQWSVDEGIKEAVADQELEKIFNGLAKNWREATGSFSLNMRRYAHPTYQVMMAALGKEKAEDVIPLILRELQQRPDIWFEALKVIAKVNPAANAKTFDEAVEAWVSWG